MQANEKAPVIIKKVKKVSGGGHHGGAWKVAYADFVTAMMAFFLLMWLLNATTEKQRKGLADYFNPTIPITRVSGGGDGSFSGDDVFSEDELSQSGTGGVPSDPTAETGGDDVDPEAQQAEMEKLEEMLFGRGGESMASEGLARHIVTRVTDEGLIVDLFELDDSPLFYPGTDHPTELLEQLVKSVAEVFLLVKNGIAVEGHVATQPVVMKENTGWSLSSDRAAAVRLLVEAASVPQKRIRRVTGHADRKHVSSIPTAARNNRIELILLRSGR